MAAGRWILAAAFTLLCIHDIVCQSDEIANGTSSLYKRENVNGNGDDILPEISPSISPEPLVPLNAPSPLEPFQNSSTPKLSGMCSLNFTAVNSLMNSTAVDCFSVFAPFLANVICCPQLQATLVILIGHSSKETGMLALDSTNAKHCLSDVQQLLTSQGASDDLQNMCSVHLSNFTEGACPVKDVNAFESAVDSSKLLAACRKVDPVNECCSQVCQNAITEASRKISFKESGLNSYSEVDTSFKMDSCRNIVLRWLSSRLDQSEAKRTLRQISNCKMNTGCPLSFPDTSKVAKECGDRMKNHTLCCREMNNYVAHLQKQSFVTNLQALNCAATLGAKLQKMNVTTNVYSLCQKSLKDFSVQVGSQENGCLLPSMPSDATLDPKNGISFTCDLNDNIAAPWPSSLEGPESSCNKSVNFPELPAATPTVNGGQCTTPISLCSLFVALLLLLQRV